MHDFRPGYSCESQIIAVCQDVSDSLDEAARLDAIIIDFRKLFVLILKDGALFVRMVCIHLPDYTV